VVAERRRNGAFKSLHDLAERLDPSIVNRRQLENLAKAGAFDPLEKDRARAFAACETLSSYCARRAEERASAQGSLFALAEPSLRPPLPKGDPWSAQERLDFERESVGFFLSGHPLADFFAARGTGEVTSYSDIREEGETEPRTYAMAGVVQRIMARPARDGGVFAYVSLSDPTAEFEVMVAPEQFAVQRSLLEVGKAMGFRCRARWRDGDLKLSADSFEPIEAVEARTAHPLRVDLREGAPLADLSALLAGLPPGPAAERRPVLLTLRLEDGREVELSLRQSVSAGAAARAALKSARGVERVH
jgi:DNA polymerase-3 subunit alpha